MWQIRFRSSFNSEEWKALRSLVDDQNLVTKKVQGILRDTLGPKRLSYRS